MPEEQAAFDVVSALAESRKSLGREQETQTAGWAMVLASSSDDYDRDSGMEVIRNVARTPTDAVEEEKLKPSMLCKNENKINRSNRDNRIKTLMVEEIRMDKKRPPDRSTSR